MLSSKWLWCFSETYYYFFSLSLLFCSHYFLHCPFLVIFFCVSISTLIGVIRNQTLEFWVISFSFYQFDCEFHLRYSVNLLHFLFCLLVKHFIEKYAPKSRSIRKDPMKRSKQSPYIHVILSKLQFYIYTIAKSTK